MRKYFRVELARQVFTAMMKNNVVHPKALSNACFLLGIKKHMGMKNEFLLYFMMKDNKEVYDRNLQATPEEQQHIDYINSHMTEDLSDYIMQMEMKLDDNKTFKPENLLDAVFGAADEMGSVGTMENLPLQSHQEEKKYPYTMIVDGEEVTVHGKLTATLMPDGNIEIEKPEDLTPEDMENAEEIELTDDELQETLEAIENEKVIKNEIKTLENQIAELPEGDKQIRILRGQITKLRKKL